MALEIIGGYELTEIIKRGKYSISYRAQDSKKQTCIIKQHFLKKVTEDAITKTDQWKELSKKPSIVHLIDYIFLQREKSLYMVSEFMKDGNLYDYIINFSPERNKILILMYDIARALADLHNSFVIHQNLHLQNIFVYKHGQRMRCKVGEALIFNQKTSNVYDPPEITEAMSINTESNIYSLGLMYVAMYRGIVEINKEKMLFPYLQIGNKWRSISWLQKRSKDVSPHLEEIYEDNHTLQQLVIKMLEYEQENRPDIQNVIDTIQKVIPQMQETDEVDSGSVQSVVDIKKSRTVQFDESSIEPTKTVEAEIEADQEQFSVRVRSFPNSWPYGTEESPQLSPENMANVGFFYIGQPDVVKCYSCGSKLSKWNSNDDPWEEHKKWNESCVLVEKHTQNLQDALEQARELEESIGEPKFKVIGPLGKGGFGVVEKVHLLEKGDVIARKVVKLNDKQLRKEIAELEIARTLGGHQNIIKMIGAFYTEKILVLHLELSEIGSLDKYIVNRKPKFTELYGFLIDMANGVNYLHHSNIIHRDLKPANILIFTVAGNLICKLADFGISKCNYQADMKVTHPGKPSLHWSAPETENFNQTHTSVDIYSMGAIFVALAEQYITPGPEGDLLPLCRHKKTFKNLDRIVLHIDYEGVEKLTNFLLPVFSQDEPMAKLVATMVQEEPEDRPGSQEVCEELEKICDTKKRPYVPRNQYYDVPKENALTDYIPKNNNYQCPQQ